MTFECYHLTVSAREGRVRVYINMYIFSVRLVKCIYPLLPLLLITEPRIVFVEINIQLNFFQKIQIHSFIIFIVESVVDIQNFHKWEMISLYTYLYSYFIIYNLLIIFFCLNLKRIEMN